MSVPGRRQGFSSSEKSTEILDLDSYALLSIFEPASMSISVMGFPLGPYTGFALTSNDDVFIAGEEAEGFVEVGVALPVRSTFRAGDCGRLELSSAEMEGVLDEDTFIALIREDWLMIE